MIFAGDEIGLEGIDGEDSRRPMPWHRPERWDHETLGAYRDLIAVRQAHPALRRGGLRWVIEADDAIGYLRETGRTDPGGGGAGGVARCAAARTLAGSGSAETLYGGSI